VEQNNIVEWNPTSMLEISLNEPDDFLKVRETLTRIGVASRKDKKLFQSCHILHKQGRYFIVHFKELFLLISIETGDKMKPLAPMRQIKIIPFKEKNEWELCPKYNIGNK